MNFLELAVHFGLFFGVLALGVWLERRAGSAAVYRALPPWAKLLTGGVAFGLPWVPYWQGLYPALPPDPLHWVLALNAILWIGTPVALAAIVDIRQPEPAC